MKPRIAVALFAAWCVVVLATFALANANGYAAFASAGRPTPIRPIPGQRHK